MKRLRIPTEYKHPPVREQMDKPQTHTPTPWFVDTASGDIVSGPLGKEGWSAEGQAKMVTVARPHGPSGEWGKVGPEHEANTAFIVRCVNAYSEMAALLKEIHILHRELNISDHLDNRIQEAISKAEGK